jgi:hypothetical protein
MFITKLGELAFRQPRHLPGSSLTDCLPGEKNSHAIIVTCKDRAYKFVPSVKTDAHDWLQVSHACLPLLISVRGVCMICILQEILAPYGVFPTLASIWLLNDWAVSAFVGSIQAITRAMHKHL